MAILYLRNRIIQFYQDRLGTNIGKTQKKRVSFSCREKLESLSSLTEELLQEGRQRARLEADAAADAARRRDLEGEVEALRSELSMERRRRRRRRRSYSDATRGMATATAADDDESHASARVTVGRDRSRSSSRSRSRSSSSSRSRGSSSSSSSSGGEGDRGASVWEDVRLERLEAQAQLRRNQARGVLPAAAKAERAKAHKAAYGPGSSAWRERLSKVGTPAAASTATRDEADAESAGGMAARGDGWQEHQARLLKQERC